MSFEAALHRVAAVERTLGLRRTAVLFITVWMTWRAFTWATSYASAAMAAGGGLEATAMAAIIVAVTAPVAYLQKAVFTAYLDSKAPPNV